LKRITCDSTYQPYVEWLGTMWGHAVAPSTPIPDLKLHIQAWQHYFAAMFGWDALARVKGFSPPEMHLPNHPDTLYEYVKALKECGYKWLMVQEHSVQTLNGEEIKNKHTPHKLVARNSQGESVSITALIKTQGSDTKLVAQMQPYYEAKSLNSQNNSYPPIVTQIGDGENGGVMMNEFPPGYKQAWHDMKQNGGGTKGVVGVNGTEYLELIENAGANPQDYPVCQPVGQHLIWERVSDSQNVEQVIEQLKQENPNFHMDGASWTNHISWVQGYENVLNPMNKLSSLFHQKFDSLLEADQSTTQKHEYREALLHNFLLQTSCFRYWGQGTWTDYAREIYQRGEKTVNSEQ
ncbi:MAG: glycosyl hydrolase family 57, partial [Cyanobacteria bacterium J06636_27]